MKKETKPGKQDTNQKSFLARFIPSLVIVSCILSLAASAAFAQTPDPNASNPNSPGFRLVVCDGPAKANIYNDKNYIPCDFRGLMIQARHLINVMIILGVLAAIVGFCWAGFLYITGTPGNITKAHTIFRQVAVGFIIMLAAWFIVYQILSWLTGNPGLKALLGSP